MGSRGCGQLSFLHFSRPLHSRESQVSFAFLKHVLQAKWLLSACWCVILQFATGIGKTVLQVLVEQLLTVRSLEFKTLMVQSVG